MNNLDQLLSDGLNELADSAPADPELVNTVVRRSRHRRLVTLAPLAAAVAVLAVATTALALRPGNTQPAVSPTSACSPVQTGVLPTWARAGFSDPVPSASFVTSQDGQMVAIIFADPLRSPTSTDAANKILWVAKDPASQNSTLRISGQMEGGTATMQTTVEGGPGPSTVDVPMAGCWQFRLAWGNHHDVINIPYAAR
jgi:hypothetical protein